MLTEIYIEALLVDEELADQVQEALMTAAWHGITPQTRSARRAKISLPPERS